MNSYAYYNGEFGEKDEIKCPITDRALYFGDGVYDAAIGQNGKIFLLREHIERLLGNAKKIGIEHPYSASDLTSLITEFIKKSGLESYFLYFQISRSTERRTHSSRGSTANLLMLAEPHKITDYRIPLKLVSYDDLRYGYCDIKTLNLLPSVFASTKADTELADEAVFIRKGIVTECAKSNVSILKGGMLFTHPTNNHILPGITRRHLLALCKRLSIPTVEIGFSYDELLAADEIIVTSTTKLAKRAESVDGIPCGMKDERLAAIICQNMHKEYVDATRI